MDTATIGIAEEEDEEQGVDEEHIFYRMVFFLAAITRGLLRRVLGADDPPFRAVSPLGCWRSRATMTRRRSSTSGSTLLKRGGKKGSGSC